MNTPPVHKARAYDHSNKRPGVCPNCSRWALKLYDVRKFRGSPVLKAIRSYRCEACSTRFRSFELILNRHKAKNALSDLIDFVSRHP